MHKKLIFIFTFCLLSSQMTQTSYGWLSWGNKKTQHVLSYPHNTSTDSYSGLELQLSGYLYNVLYVYNIQPADQLHDDQGSWRKISDSVKYDNDDHSQLYRTDYIWHLQAACENYERNKKKYSTNHDQHNLFFITSIIAKMKNSEAGWNAIKNIAIQAGPDIHARYYIQPTEPIMINLAKIGDIETWKAQTKQKQILTSIKNKYKDNPQKFYNELVPTLAKMYPEKFAESNSLARTTIHSFEIEHKKDDK